MEVSIRLSNVWNTLFANQVISTLIDFIFTPVQSIVVDLLTIENAPSWVSTVLDYVTKIFALLIPSDITLFGLMFSNGLILFIGFTIAKWAIAIVK